MVRGNGTAGMCKDRAPSSRPQQSVVPLIYPTPARRRPVLRHAGWLENEPARVTGRMEVRPAAELGPIILCLDTSASMKVREGGSRKLSGMWQLTQDTRGNVDA